jgi:hypothetical protein
MLDEIAAVEPGQPLPRDVWLPEVEVMVARDQEGDTQGLFVAAKGGHNAESHNHNDVGNWIVYTYGRPLLVDAGVETYTRKTFSAERYTIWTMQSGFHSLLPTVDGAMQAPGRGFAARDVSYVRDADAAVLTLDIAGAYPPEAGIVRWQRSVCLSYGEEVEVADSYALSRDASEIVLGLLTPCDVTAQTPGEIVLSERALPNGGRAGCGVVHYDADKFGLTVEPVPITDERLGAVWGEGLTRLVFTVKSPATADTWRFHVRAG